MATERIVILEMGFFYFAKSYCSFNLSSFWQSESALRVYMSEYVSPPQTKQLRRSRVSRSNPRGHLFHDLFVGKVVNYLWQCVRHFIGCLCIPWPIDVTLVYDDYGSELHFRAHSYLRLDDSGNTLLDLLSVAVK